MNEEELIKPKNVIGMTNKEYNYFKEGFQEGKLETERNFEEWKKLSRDVWFEEGKLEEKKEILDIISKWRVQLEDKGFITIDKHFVNDLIKEIGGMK